MAYLEELLPEFRKGAKIRCKLGFHDLDLEIVKNSSDEQECVLTYDEQVEHIYATVFINIVCKHCGKRLGSRIVRVSYSTKELGLTRMEND